MVRKRPGFGELGTQVFESGEELLGPADAGKGEDPPSGEVRCPRNRDQPGFEKRKARAQAPGDATILTFIASSYIVVLRYPTPIALTDTMRRASKSLHQHRRHTKVHGVDQRQPFRPCQIGDRERSFLHLAGLQ